MQRVLQFAIGIAVAHSCSYYIARIVCPHPLSADPCHQMESSDRYWLNELTAVPATAAILDELGVADSPAMKELDTEDCARLTVQMKKVPAKS